MEFPSLRCVSYRNTWEKNNAKTKWTCCSSVFRNGLSWDMLICILMVAVKSFQPVFFFYYYFKKAFSSYNKANGSTALKTGPHWLDKDGNLSVVFNSLNSVFSLSLISSFKQTSSIRFFSPSVNSVLFASSSWKKTVHIIGNPLVCLSLTSGWALRVKSGAFL